MLRNSTSIIFCCFFFNTFTCCFKRCHLTRISRSSIFNLRRRSFSRFYLKTFKNVKSHDIVDFTHFTHFFEFSDRRHHFLILVQFLHDHIVKLSTSKDFNRAKRRAIEKRLKTKIKFNEIFRLNIKKKSFRTKLLEEGE